MASIKMTDQLGLDIDAQPAATSALLKYAQQLPSLRLDSLDLSKLGGLTLDESAIQSVKTGVSFQDPLTLGDGGPTLTVAAGAHAAFCIVTDVDDLPGQEHGDESPKNSCYASFAVDATVSPSVSTTVGSIQFGAAPSTSLTLESLIRLPLKSGVTLTQAVQKTVAAFCVPAHCADLEALAAGQIARAAVTGKLTLSGSANLLAVTNPLASASLPAPLPAVSVSAGGSVTAGVSFEIETEYEVIARMLDSAKIRLSWRHKSESAVTVKVKGCEGISAGFGSTDLFSQVIGAVSADPKVDLKELGAAGVPEGQAEAIQGAVKAAVSRKLEIAVGAELTASDSTSAAFLYEISPAALSEQSRQAIDLALRGDLTGLHAADCPGVACVRSVWDNVRKRELSLDVNLLGILNYRSVSSLAVEGKVLYEPVTGALVITDQATAERIQTLAVNFGADTQKLRHVLAESFLITAAYQSVRQTATAPALRCSHHFFDLENSTSRHDMAVKLRTGFAIGLLSEADTEPPAGIDNFGRTLFSVATDYDGVLVTAMFLDSAGAPLSHEEYEMAGRAAIQLLVREGDEDAVRREPAIDDGLWDKMKAMGQPGIPNLFLNAPKPFVSAIVTDYTAIQWWADAMSGMAHQLASLRQWVAQHPAVGLQDPEFAKQREKLAGYLRGVAANTKDEFGQPWGLIAMNQLTGRKGGAKMLLSSPKLVLDKQSKPAAAVGG
ncbi:MAG TPA: hypothetical protein VG456_08175 [Candidatus Sulfopaludibacter sp.]|jgi:hypothetical protein|nr:hypothetical protein [Candidatus Sulfopaludibacter sp.]